MGTEETKQNERERERGRKEKKRAEKNKRKEKISSSSPISSCMKACLARPWHAVEQLPTTNRERGDMGTAKTNKRETEEESKKGMKEKQTERENKRVREREERNEWTSDRKKIENKVGPGGKTGRITKNKHWIIRYINQLTNN